MRCSRLLRIVLTIVCSLEMLGLLMQSVRPALARQGIQSCVSVSPGKDNLQNVINSHSKGTTFCLRSGTYRMTREVVIKSYDVFLGDPGAVLNGSKILTSFVKVGNYWVASGQTQQAPVGSEKCSPATYTGCRYSEGVFFDDRSLWQVTSLAQLSVGEFYFDYANDKIYLADNPTGHTVEASTARAAIWGAAGYQDHVTIKGLRIEKFANWPSSYNSALKPGNYWVVENNEVRLNHGIGIFGSTGSVIRGNNIHDNGKYGVFSSGTQSTLFEGNEIAHNNVVGFDPWQAGGSKVVKTKNLTFRGNRVHHNIGPGLKADTDNIYTLYENNVVENNTREGITHEISYDAVIRNNTVRFNDTDESGLSLSYGSNIHLNDSQNVEIYGNRVATTADTNGIGMRDSDRGSGAYGLYEIRNDYVHDNTITMEAGSETGIVGNRNPNVYSSMGNSFKNNTYYLPSLSARYWQWKGGAQTKESWQGYRQDMTGHFYQK